MTYSFCEESETEKLYETKLQVIFFEVLHNFLWAQARRVALKVQEKCTELKEIN